MVVELILWHVYFLFSLSQDICSDLFILRNLVGGVKLILNENTLQHKLVG